MHPRYDALPVPYIILRYTYSSPRCRTSQYHAGHLFPSQYLRGTFLLNLYSMVWDWLVLRAGPMLFYWPPQLLVPFFCLILYLPITFFLWVGIEGLGSLD